MPNFTIPLLGSILAFLLGGFLGHMQGINQQKVTDQAQFDKISQDIARQKSEASALLTKAQQEIIKAQAESDAFKTQLEVDREKNRDDIDALRRKYAGDRLRFVVPAKQNPGCGSSGGGTGEAQGKAPSADATTVIQLPDQITGNLRQLVLDADKLSSEYSTCYRYVNR